MVELLAQAKDELDEAAIFYEDEREGLGLELLDEVLAARKRIADFPEMGTPWVTKGASEVIRSMRVKRFPHRLYYVTEPHLLVLAVAHFRRKPGYWLPRLREL
ncbi:MAG: type II toxin-antitoxin system RelE/ParE family toxin [Alphaproteobacteria bacterium]|nr:type II toxin-antitoxin system RelE/ParE family toxin [Alphaproteobacteria bacterium]